MASEDKEGRGSGDETVNFEELFHNILGYSGYSGNAEKGLEVYAQSEHYIDRVRIDVKRILKQHEIEVSSLNVVKGGLNF